MKYKVRMSVIMHPDEASLFREIISRLKLDWTKEFNDLTASAGMLSLSRPERERDEKSILELANTLALRNAEGTIIGLGEEDKITVHIQNKHYSVDRGLL